MCLFCFLFSPSLFWTECCDLKVTPALLTRTGVSQGCCYFLPVKQLRSPFQKNLWAPSRTAGCIFGCGLGLAGLQGEFPLLARDSALIKHSVPAPAGRARSRGTVHLRDDLHAQHIPAEPCGLDLPTAGAAPGFLRFSEPWVERANPSGWQDRGQLLCLFSRQAAQ